MIRNALVIFWLLSIMFFSVISRAETPDHVYGKFIPHEVAKNIVIPIKPRMVADTPMMYIIRTALLKYGSQKANIFPVREDGTPLFYVIDEATAQTFTQDMFVKTKNVPGLTEREITYTHFIPVNFCTQEQHEQPECGDNYLGYYITLYMNGVKDKLKIKLIRREIHQLENMREQVSSNTTEQEVQFDPSKILLVLWKSELPTRQERDAKYELQPYVQVVMINLEYYFDYLRAQDREAATLKEIVD